MKGWRAFSVSPSSARALFMKLGRSATDSNKCSAMTTQISQQILYLINHCMHAFQNQALLWNDVRVVVCELSVLMDDGAPSTNNLIWGFPFPLFEFKITPVVFSNEWCKYCALQGCATAVILAVAISQVLVPVIHSLVVLDADGDRLLAKYYDGRAKAEQLAYEQMVNKKTKNVPAKVDGKFHVTSGVSEWRLLMRTFNLCIAEAILLDHEVVVFRSSADCKFFVCGSSMEVKASVCW